MNTTQLLERIRLYVRSVDTIHTHTYMYMYNIWIWHCLLNGIFIQSSRFLFLFRHEPIAQYSHFRRERVETRTNTHTNGHKNINLYVHQREFWISIVCAELCSFYVRACILRICMCVCVCMRTTLYHAPMVKIHIVAESKMRMFYITIITSYSYFLAVFRRVAICSNRFSVPSPLILAYFFILRAHKHIFILIQCLLT